MIPELGSFAIILALALALLQCAGSIHKNVTLSRVAACSQFIFLSFAMLCLIVSFVNNDMTILYVREHSHALLPFIYRVGAAWGGHEGSLLLWCLILSGWTLAFIVSKQEPTTDKNHIISILGLLSAGFIAFLFFTSNPFLRDFPSAPIVGNDLTPILQDPGLIFHPPMLYMGYVGFAICFAFAINALIQGKFDQQTARACRPWVVLPWAFLSCGIVLGSWWAYRELGWGGWWFWDPVENASLLPWLSATALLHSLIVTEKRDVFKGWTILLAIVTFTLSLLGTFLVRSGVLVSVHAFASDPTRGIFLLAYLAFIIGGALLLYSYRIKLFYQAPNFKLLSRETFLLVNSVVLLTAVITIVIGTLYPIVLDALDYGKISVGEPYFNVVFVPIMLPSLLLMGLAPHIHWQQHAIKPLMKKLSMPFLASLLLGFSVPKLMGFEFHFLASIGIFISLWIMLATLNYAYQLAKTSNTISIQHISMIIAHIGIAVLALGVIVNKSYSEERQVKIAPGETTTIAGYEFNFKSIAETRGDNYQSIAALFNVEKNHRLVSQLSAEQRIYTSHQETLSKPGVLFNPWRDLYLALGNSLPDNSWSVRIYYKPMVRWIWAGGFLLLFGGLLSLLRHVRENKIRPHKQSGFYTIPLLIFLIILVILWRGLTLHPNKIPSPFINKPAPAFVLPTLFDANKMTSNADLIGHVTLVNVWASWCYACAEEHAALLDLANLEHLIIYGLNYKDDPVTAKQWLKQNGNPYKIVAVDQSGDTAIDWGVYGAPETFVLDKKGIIRYKQIGGITAEVWERNLHPLIVKLQGEPA